MSEDINVVREKFEKEIIKILYDNQNEKSLTEAQIRKDLSERVKANTMRQYLDFLKQKKLIREHVSKTPRTKSMPAMTHYRYSITPMGIDFVNDGFTAKEKVSSKILIFGENVNFGSINYNNFDIKLELDKLDISSVVREEIEHYFKNLEEEVKKEEISKNKVKDILCELASKGKEKGIDKLAEWGLAILINSFK